MSPSVNLCSENNASESLGDKALVASPLGWPTLSRPATLKTRDMRGCLSKLLKRKRLPAAPGPVTHDGL